MATRNLNKVMLIGNLTRDPELRYTPQGNAVASFVIATNREWVAGGEKKQAADFHNVVAWNKLAEICSQLLKRGTKVFVEGRLQTRSWQDTDGSKKYKTEIIIDDMIILTKKNADGELEDADAEGTDIQFDAGTAPAADLDFNNFDLDLDSVTTEEK